MDNTSFSEDVRYEFLALSQISGTLQLQPVRNVTDNPTLMLKVLNQTQDCKIVLIGNQSKDSEISEPCNVKLSSPCYQVEIRITSPSQGLSDVASLFPPVLNDLCRTASQLVFKCGVLQLTIHCNTEIAKMLVNSVSQPELLDSAMLRHFLSSAFIFCHLARVPGATRMESQLDSGNASMKLIVEGRPPLSMKVFQCSCLNDQDSDILEQLKASIIYSSETSEPVCVCVLFNEISTCEWYLKTKSAESQRKRLPNHDSTCVQVESKNSQLKFCITSFDFEHDGNYREAKNLSAEQTTNEFSDDLFLFAVVEICEQLSQSHSFHLELFTVPCRTTMQLLHTAAEQTQQAKEKTNLPISLTRPVVAVSLHEESAMGNLSELNKVLSSSTTDRSVMENRHESFPHRTTVLCAAAASLTDFTQGTKQHSDCVQTLVRYGADPGASDRRMHTMLHCAVLSRNIELIHECLSNKFVDINCADVNGATPLMLAVKDDNLLIAETLLKNRANSKLTDNLGRSALIFAVNSGDVELVKLLMQFEPELLSDSGAKMFSSLYLAAWRQEHSDICLFLHENKYQTNEASISVAEKLCSLIKLSKTKQFKKIASAENCNWRGWDARTPLMVAANRPLLRTKDLIDCVDWLLMCGAEKSFTDLQGNTAMHLAAVSNNAEVIKLLLKDGASPHTNNLQGFTPLELAKMKGNAEARMILETAEASNPRVPSPTSAVGESKRGTEASERLQPKHKDEKSLPRQKTVVKQSNSSLIIETVERLGLNSQFPGKISWKDIVQVTKMSIKEEREIFTEKDVAWKVIRAIINCDADRRDFVPEIKSTRKTNQGMALLRSIEEDESGDCENQLNPMDVLLISYLCCDKEVQQMLCSCLFKCKLAFPFIYSTADKSMVLSNWSLRDIVVQFRDEQDQYIETSLFSDYHFPIVSFVRMGELHMSKSKLLNSLLSGKSYGTFFHRDCTNGHTRRVCSNGLVEATVFLPSEISSRSGMGRAFLAANLRGDLLEFDEQARILADVSHSIVIFVDLEILTRRACLVKLRQLSEKTKIFLAVFRSRAKPSEGRVPLCSEDDKKFIASTPTLTAFSGLKTKAEMEILDDLQRMLSTELINIDNGGVNRMTQQCEYADFDHDVKVTMKKAGKLFRRIEDADHQSLFKKCLPLTLLWQEYCELLRKEYKQKAHEEDIEDSKAKRVRIRNEQIQILEESRALALTFAKELSAYCNSNTDGLVAKMYLQWTKLNLDAKSRKNFPALLERKRELTYNLHSKQELERLNAKQLLLDLEQQMRSCSVGLEHLLREEGQLYESVREATVDFSPALRDLADSLPKCFANLLLWGVPLEIFDGDVGTIPSAWISAILKSCQELAGDKKIYVISMLGPQSSGKSTLLNTMFGLKFAVSAGRCTRGAFLQLVPVESGMPFDYIALIDTEGLKDPELKLDFHHHESKMATLGIGLGDVTIINIKGENAAEMTDILNTVIRAFIKINVENRKKFLHRHCIFVHQNVSAVGAKELMQDASFKMGKTLDAMTKEAAEKEGFQDKMRFVEVLKFNPETDLFYMSNLWQGDLPMASVNPGYSVCAKMIRQHLLHIFDNKQRNFLGFVDFSHRLNDLWKAILSEDFAFS